jgi:hypothetical protein
MTSTDTPTAQSVRRLWWIIAIGIFGSLAALVLYFSSLRDHHAPTPVVVSECHGLATDTRRIASDAGTVFDVPESAFAVNARSQDMPPGRFHVVVLRGSAANLVIGHDDGIWPDLRTTFPTFSRRVAGRDIRTTKERSVGTDKWGYLKGGMRWRYVAFSSGDAIGYRPTPLQEANLLDAVINSACIASNPE